MLSCSAAVGGKDTDVIPLVVASEDLSFKGKYLEGAVLYVSAVDCVRFVICDLHKLYYASKHHLLDISYTTVVCRLYDGSIRTHGRVRSYHVYVQYHRPRDARAILARSPVKL